jgi:hypothetical protein
MWTIPLPTASSLILSIKYYVERTTNYEVPHCVIFSSLFLFHPYLAQKISSTYLISNALRLHTLINVTNFNTHAKHK